MVEQRLRGRLALIVVAGVMVVAAPIQSSAQRAEDLSAPNKRISELYGAQKRDEAILLAENSLDPARTQMDADQLETAIVNWIAKLTQGCCPEAALYERALAVDEKGRELDKLAEVYRGSIFAQGQLLHRGNFAHGHCKGRLANHV